MILFSGCRIHYANERNAYKYIPDHAIFVADYGNGWIEFKLDKENYLYHRINSGIWSRESLTQIK